MRSEDALEKRGRVFLRQCGWALLLGAALCLPTAAFPSEAGAAPLTREQVRAELDKLRADPQMPGVRKQKTLRFKQGDKKPEVETPPRLPGWMKDFAQWISSAGRVLVWAVGLVLAVMLLVAMRHWVRIRALAAPRHAAQLPSHVRDLDIRPESLPEDVGSAARALWLRGEHRPALSLLYRGALSCLVHRHGIPIRAASTEGECVAMAARRLPPGRSAFFGRLVHAWQLAVYGARLPETPSVLALCGEFDAQLHALPVPQTP